MPIVTGPRFELGQTFMSNNGEGPDHAVIIEFRSGVCKTDPRGYADPNGDTVVLETFNANRRAPSYSFLPVWFLSSPACGWKLAALEEVK